MNKLLTATIIGLSIVLSTGCLAYSVVLDKNNKTKIAQLQEENKELNVKLIKISEEIQQKQLQDKIGSLDWTPDEEMTGILSMDENSFMTLTDIYLQVEGEELIKEHLDSLVTNLEYVGGYTLDRYPSDQEIGLPGGYGRYDLVFYIDVEKVETVMTEDLPEKDNMLTYLENHGVVGL